MRFKDFISEGVKLNPLERFEDLLHHIAEEELVSCKVFKLEASGKNGVKVFADCQDVPREEGDQRDLTKKLQARLKLHPRQGFNRLRCRVFHQNVDKFQKLGDGK